MTRRRRTRPGSLRGYVLPLVDAAMRSALASGQDVGQAIAEVLNKPEVLLRRKAASPQEQAAMGDELNNVIIPDLRGRGFLPDDHRDLVAQAAQTGLPVEPPDVSLMLARASAPLIAAADKALAASCKGDPPTQDELAAWMADGLASAETLREVGDKFAALDGIEPDKVCVIGWAFGGLVILRDGVQHHAPAADMFTAAIKAELPNPLGTLVSAWARRLGATAPNSRSDRILPARLAMAKPGDPRAGRLFSLAVHSPDGQQVLPGFGQAAPDIALPLALYDLGAGPAEARGRGAALALRLFIESVLAVGQDARSSNQPVPLEVPLRDLLARLYPQRRPSPARYWPRLVAAAEALDAWEARIPWQDPDTGRGGLRRVVSVGDIPRGPDALDDVVRILVDLPPGSEVGPVVSPSLALWGTRSAAAYRLLLNLAYHWWEPGRTRVPVGGRRQHWVQASDPARYRPISDDALVRLTFPTSARKNRRVLLAEARKVLHQLAQERELRVVDSGGRRVLPPGGNDHA